MFDQRSHILEAAARTTYKEVTEVKNSAADASSHTQLARLCEDWGSKQAGSDKYFGELKQDGDK